MGYLDTVVLPERPKGTTPPTGGGGGGYLSSVVLPDNAYRSNELARYEKEAKEMKAISDAQNSIPGLFKSTVSDIWETTKRYWIGSGQQVVDFAGEVVESPSKALTKRYNEVGEDIVHLFVDNFSYGTETVQKMLEDHENGTGSTAGDVANLARLISSTAGMIFSPITGTLEAAQELPVLKQVADAINAPFTVAGYAGAFASGKALDVMPISQESKDILKQPIEELGTLAAQIFFGGKVMSKLADTFVTKGTVTPVEATRIITEIRRENPQIFQLESGIIDVNLRLPPPLPAAPIQLPGAVQRRGTKMHEEYMREMGYETYVAAEKLPVIQVGKPPKSELPVVQIETPARRAKDDLVYEPLKDEQPKVYYYGTTRKNAEVILDQGFKQKEIPLVQEKKNAVENAEAIVEVRLKKGAEIDTTTKAYKPEDVRPVAIESAAKPATKVEPKSPNVEGEKAQSTLAAKVEARAIEEGLTSGFGRLPEYRRVNMKEQAQFAADIINADPQRALNMAMGRERVPDHVIPEAIFTAVENRAVKMKDVETLRALASDSPMSLEATAMGQRIRALGERVADSPVKIIQEIRNVREAAIEKRSKGKIEATKKAIASDIKVEIKKAASKRPTWEEFIKEVQCQY